MHHELVLDFSLKVTPKYFLLEYTEFQLSPKARWQLRRLQNVHWKCFSGRKSVPKTLIFELNHIFPIFLQCSFFQMHNQCWFSIWSHVFFKGALQITCWAVVSCRSNRSFKSFQENTQIVCGIYVEAPEQKNVRLRLMQHIVNPP